IIELYDLVRPGLGRKVLAAASALSSTAVAISQAVADCIGPRGARHVRIVPLSVALDRFGPGPVSPQVRQHLTSDESAPLGGVVGRIGPGKGVDVLGRAV